MSGQTHAVSAPGKVLFAGGYLILDRAHTGLVLGIDARIHVHVRPLQTAVAGVSIREIVVKSPQFHDAVWRYGYHAEPAGGGVRAVQLITDSGGRGTQARANPFVETALSYALSYVASASAAAAAAAPEGQSASLPPAEFVVLADAAYYSSSQLADPPSQTAARGAGARRFARFDTTIWDAHKTGLGSSAALVTALTAAVLAHYLSPAQLDLRTADGRRRAHSLAQTAHCAAQGKVGSGFDVASAVFGSCIYRRFSPALLDGVGEPASAGFAPALKKLVDDLDWDTEVAKDNVTVPEGVRLVMCDVDCGSQTPGMVKKVLAWRKQDPEDAGRIWTALQRNNDALAAALVRLAQGEARGTAGDGRAELRQRIATLRELVREMSRLSGVEIEPAAQTRLLDACESVPGVIGGVTPGAGGYDAIALLVEDRPEVLDQLQRLVQSWEFRADDADPGAGKVRILDIREELEGLRLEDAAGHEYTAWL